MRKATAQMISLLILLLAGVQQVDAGTVTLTGTNQVEDVFLRGDQYAGGTTASQNFGGNDFIMVGRLADGVSNTNLANTLLRFSGFSSLSNQVVQSATLRIWNQNHVNQTADVAIDVYEVAAANGDWVEGNGVGSVITGTSDWRFKIQNTGEWAGGRNGCGVAGTDYVNSLVGSAVATNTTQEWVDFTLDADVIQNWIDNPDQNNGLVLTAPGALEGEVALFYSSEKGGNSMPQLVLETILKTTETLSFSGTNQVEDVYLRGDDSQVSAVRNFGGSEILIAGRLASNVVINTLLRFADLSSLSGRTVSNATLRFYNYDHANQTSDVTIDVYEVASANGDWVEGDGDGTAVVEGASDWRFKSQNDVDWAGGRNGCGVAGTDYTTNLVGSALFADTTAEWVDIELDASVVQNWINNPGQNYGLVLTAPGATNSGELAYLHSSENVAGSGPQLLVDVLIEKSFENWAQANSLSGDDALAAADPDHDGMDNLLEYALGGNPGSNDVASIRPAFSMVDATGTRWLEYVYNRRLDAAARGLDYSMILSEDLTASWTNIGQTAETGSAPIDDDFEVVTNRISADVAVKFATLEVTEE